MRDFWYQISTKIIFGKNKIDEIGSIVNMFGKNPLLIYGSKHIKQSGLYYRIVDNLTQNNLQFTEFGGINSNPDIFQIREGVQLAKKSNVDCIIAVGGGSVIDAGKCIAFGALTDIDVWHFFENNLKPEQALPMITAVTLAASGSEMNPGAVLSNAGISEKKSIGAPCLVPKVSIMDPLLTVTTPSDYTAYGIIDAFSHIMEGYFNGEEMFLPVQDSLAEGLFKSIIEMSPLLMENLNNYDCRADMMWAACMAHNGSLNVGRGKVIYEIHLLAHMLGVMYHIPHGAAISAVLPGWMTFRIQEKGDKISRFSEKVMNVDNSRNKQEMSVKGIYQLKKWISSLNSPTSLKDLAISEDDVPKIISSLTPVFSGGGVKNMDETTIQVLIKNILY